MVKLWRICKTFWSIQTKLVFYVEDFKVFARNWTLVLCERNQSLSSKIFYFVVIDLELRLPAWILIPNNGKRLSLKGTRKSLSSPEQIGFHSVAIVWFSFHWLFWLLRSAGCMFSSVTGIFLSLLHAKVGRERLVYFIVSNHSVSNIYFIKWLGLNLPRTKFDQLVTFFTVKDIDSLFGDFFCSLRNSTCHQLFNVFIARLNTISWFPSMLNKGKEKLRFLRLLCFSSTETIGGQISTRAGVIAC